MNDANKWIKAFIYLLLPLCLISCATSPQPITYTVYLTRHFEKTKEPNDPKLTEKGNKQAEIFASLLDNKPISTIYSTDYRRTILSAKPLATTLNLVIEKYDPRKPDALINRVTANLQDQVIVGHSNTIPDLVTRLGGLSQLLSESDYGLVFAVSITMLEGVRIRTETRKIMLLDNVSG